MPYPYIKSLIDSDLYKFTMQEAVLEHYPHTNVTYKFTNRNTTMKFNGAAYNAIVASIKAMGDLQLTDDELNFMQHSCRFLGLTYLNYLRNYRFKPEQVTVKFLDGDLDISIAGPWHETILWEVPLMAIISEAYFDFVDTQWKLGGHRCDLGGCRKVTWQEDYSSKAKEKTEALTKMNDKFTDFGTRRRRSYEVQDLVVKTFKESGVANFFGTSNVHFAHKYNLRPIGTMAHEWIMGVSALESLRYANKFALTKWQETYQGSLGYALTDTFGTEAFFADFNQNIARLYDGVRHDSGCPFTFADKVVAHYEKLGIDPTTKLIVFSDSLDVEKALAISGHCHGRIRCSFGIGTHFTNDFKNSKALNMVIKLRDVEGIPVVKLSDDFKKATGDADAIRVALWTFFKKPLD
jgi:nicotinate phosphoribosyltransferase